MPGLESQISHAKNSSFSAEDSALTSRLTPQNWLFNRAKEKYANALAVLKVIHMLRLDALKAKFF